MTPAASSERAHRPGHAQGPGGGHGPEGVSKVKAVVLIVVAVVLGVALLRVDRQPGTASAGAATTSTTTTSVPATTTTTTAPVQPTQSVKVLVANGGTVNGAATFFTQKLAKLGWGTLSPTTTSAPAAASAVYYADGQKGAAGAIAGDLGLDSSVVRPVTSSVPVAGATAASVVVVVGPDLAPQVTAAGS